jgi:hypothetical protein
MREVSCKAFKIQVLRYLDRALELEHSRDEIFWMSLVP